MSEKLNFEGCETITTDPYYDICNGYYDEEIKCKVTLAKVKEAVRVLKELELYLGDNDLIG